MSGKLKTTPPTTAEGIERFLASGMARGIGAVFAKRIVAAFGEHTFEIIEQNPEKLREVDGIGQQRAQRIAAGWTEQKGVRDIMVFLHSHGVGASRAVRIYKTYGQDAIQVMTGDPYRLAHDIRGIGFRTADAIAMRLGLTKEAPARVPLAPPNAYSPGSVETRFAFFASSAARSLTLVRQRSQAVDRLTIGFISGMSTKTTANAGSCR